MVLLTPFKFVSKTYILTTIQIITTTTTTTVIIITTIIIIPAISHAGIIN